MAAYTKAHLDELASTQYPHWIPIRHALGIETFGMNAYRRNTGEAVVPEHDEAESGVPELFYVATGAATFSNADDTLVLAIGGAKPGETYTPDGWEAQYLD